MGGGMLGEETREQERAGQGENPYTTETYCGN